MDHKMSRSPWVSHYDGSCCNGCDIEVLASLTPLFDAERFGVVNTGNPKHADIFLVTGSVNAQNLPVVRQIYSQMLEPKCVVACGICACSGGVFRDAYNVIGGLKHDIEDSELAGIVQTLDAMRPDYEALVHTFLDDDSCGERLHGVGVISKKDALELSMVGPFGRASGVDYDVRMFGDGAYADLAAFEPIVATDGDCYARCQVRCAEVTQAMDIIKELVGKIPHDGIGGRTKLTPADGARGEVVIEQPRGEAYYYVRGNGTKNLDRFRVRTPTSQNLAGLTHALQGVLLDNVPMIILTIDPCISCTEG